ncbi:MAPEG family protein [Methylobacterium sp. ID0610]|uniref:MAPEG family protein n=1 Tax=Methylobacterium carpenticola TaxID=3344827 RepID=UPI0036A9BCC4
MMPIEIRLLAYAVLLGFAHIVAASAAGLTQRGGLTWAAGNRETQTPVTGAAGRLERASKNFFETFPLFATLVLAAAAIGRHNTAVVLGSHLYFWARLVYLPVYGFGIPMIRTLIWGVAMVGIAFVFVGLFTKIGPFVR